MVIAHRVQGKLYLMMEEDEIKAIVSNEMTNCAGDEWVNRKEIANEYYHGRYPQPSGIKGRSEVVSTDVADAVHWLLPNIVESLSGKSVKFMPMSAMDEDQADLETDFTHFVFNEENSGFLNLYEAHQGRTPDRSWRPQDLLRRRARACGRALLRAV